MKSSSLIVCIALTLGSAAVAQQSTGVQGSASGASQSSVAADRNGASASHSAAGSASAATESASTSLDQGAELNATLTKPVDARSAKPGDEVIATANEDLKSHGQVVVKKGSKLVGHVTAARPLGPAQGSASGAADSQLGIVFDRAVAKDGREVPLNASIQALAAAQSSASSGLSDVDAGFGGAGGAVGSARSGGGGLVGGVAGGAAGAVGGLGRSAGGAMNSGVSATSGALGKSAGAVGGLNATGQLASGSKGVFGMKDIDIDIASATAGSAEGSVLSSSAHNVRLDRGTRMLLVSGSGAGSAATGVSKGAPSASGNAAGAADGAGRTNSGAVNAAGSGAGAASVTGDQSRGATAPESSAAPAREPVDKR
jgi:hypothetical protein